MYVAGRGRVEARKRKFCQAIKPFEKIFDINNTYWEVQTKSQAVEVTMYFKYQGVKYRFDWNFKIDEPMPKVEEIRQELWARLMTFRSKHGTDQQRYYGIQPGLNDFSDVASILY